MILYFLEILGIIFLSTTASMLSVAKTPVMANSKAIDRQDYTVSDSIV